MVSAWAGGARVKQVRDRSKNTRIIIRVSGRVNSSQLYCHSRRVMTYDLICHDLRVRLYRLWRLSIPKGIYPEGRAILLSQIVTRYLVSQPVIARHGCGSRVHSARPDLTGECQRSKPSPSPLRTYSHTPLGLHRAGWNSYIRCQRILFSGKPIR